MYLEKAKRREEEMHRIGYDQCIPCTIEEIEEIEAWIMCRLPEAYREFLLWMGHSGGGFLRGSDCFYQDLKKLRGAAQELLDEDNFPGKMPEDVFIFFMHQGYQFNFFHLRRGDDPPVFCYLEEEPVRTSLYQIYPRFSDFILTEIESHIKMRNDLKNKEIPKE